MQPTVKIVDFLKKGQVLIFSKPDCPFCKKAKDLLTQEKLKYIEYDVVEKDLSTDQLEELRNLSNGLKSFPNIFLGTRSVGGNSDLQKIYLNKELDGILEKEEIKRC
jgi:glutaredoxin 3